MRRLLVIGGLGAVVVALRKVLGLLRRNPDFTEIDSKHPQRSVVAMEQAAEIPGGVRP